MKQASGDASKQQGELALVVDTTSPVELFIRRWRKGGSAYRLTERQGAQPHYLELCDLLGIDRPADPDTYCFEKSHKGLGGKQRFADVWRSRCFAWEYKAPGGDLVEALGQLTRYALRLDNPPLLIVSDRTRIEIHTHFTGYPSESVVLQIEELRQPAKRRLLKDALTDPEHFRPRRTNIDITTGLASEFARVADRMRSRGVPAQQAAHFLIQCLFCFFAEGIDALKDKVFSRTIRGRTTAQALGKALAELFEKMKTGGDFGSDSIAWFNGGLFAQVAVPDLDDNDRRSLQAATKANWAALDPAILGTLFERGLDPNKRAQFGAFYTDPETIERIIDPAVRQPLLREWEAARARAATHLGFRDFAEIRAQHSPSSTREGRARHAAMKGVSHRRRKAAETEIATFLQRLADFRVLDAACGSGNFLYLALITLKDLECQVNNDAGEMGLHPSFAFATGPWNVLGIEVNVFAAELARVTIWIAELQWMKQHGFAWKDKPILAPLEQIEHRDALLESDGTEASWPRADVIVSNPPFLGDKSMRSELGDAYTDAVRRTYKGQVPGGADLVMYWFHKAGQAIRAGRLNRAGLVATNSIRQGTNQKTLSIAVGDSNITNAWSDLPWFSDGAAVRVSIVCWGGSASNEAWLDGRRVQRVLPNLSGQAIGEVCVDLTAAVPLPVNANASFFGFCLAGPFKIPGHTATNWLREPNPNGRPNSDVLHPIFNGKDITGRWSGKWVVDFGSDMGEAQASLYQAPFEYVRQHVFPLRVENRRTARAKHWWRYGEARPGLRDRLVGLTHYIATVETAKHRIFVRMPIAWAPEHSLIVFPTNSEVVLGILSSRIHTCWATAVGGRLGVGNDPRYNSTRCFLTFPFPHQCEPPNWKQLGQSKEVVAIANAAARLEKARDAWLNPPEWTDRVREAIPVGMKRSIYPHRIVAKPGFEAQLAKRTLTNLYNDRPTWLDNLHRELDKAVALAYGWPWPMSDEEILQRLLERNQQIAGLNHSAPTVSDRKQMRRVASRRIDQTQQAA